MLRVPVIASVGHHADRTLIDDVAAVACSTPTHAAETAVPLHCAEARAALARRAPRGWPPRAPAPSSTRARELAALLARARRARRAPAPARCTRRCARSARERDAAVRRASARRTRRRARGARPPAAAAAGPDAAGRRARSSRSRSRSPRTTPSASSSAATRSSTTARATSSRAPRRRARPAGVRLFFADAAVEATIIEERGMTEETTETQTYEAATAPAGGRSSSASTPARPACARRSNWSRGPRPRGVLRGRARRGRAGPGGAAARGARRAAGERRRMTAFDAARRACPLRVDDYALEGLERAVSSDVHAQVDRDPAARRRRGGRRRGRQLHAEAHESLQAAGPVQPLAGRLDARVVLRPRRERSTCGPSRRDRTRSCTTACGPTSPPRSTSRCARPACRCTRRSSARRGR